MRVLSLILVSLNFAVLNAFPDVFAREPVDVVALESRIPDNTVIFYPIDPDNPEQIAQTITRLEELCGSQNVKTVQTENDQISWAIALSEYESRNDLQAVSGLQIDDSANQAMDNFFNHLDKRAAQNVTGKYWSIYPTNYENDKETRATGEFIMKRAKNAQDEPTFNLTSSGAVINGTVHTIGWLHIYLTDAGKDEVKKYQGVKAMVTGVRTHFHRAVTANETPHLPSKRQDKFAHGTVQRNDKHLHWHGKLSRAVSKRVALLNVSLNALYSVRRRGIC